MLALEALTTEYGNIIYIAQHYARNPDIVSKTWDKTYKQELARTKSELEAYSIANRVTTETLKREVGGGLMLRLIQWNVIEK